MAFMEKHLKYKVDEFGDSMLDIQAGLFELILSVFCNHQTHASTYLSPSYLTMPY